MLQLILTSLLLCLEYWYGYSLEFVPEHLQNPVLQINLSQGTAQGQVRYTVGKQLQYFSFEGIPYAKPPIGNLRFKSPVAAGKWEGVLNASETAPSCIQVIPTPLNDLVESEDCLYINVFTPVQSVEEIEQSLLPVMVWIHGGAFLLGSANATYFGPDNLLEEDVVVVHFGYRLASFGFLSTGDLESPGNYGLKDQHLALRWVKNNIQRFGGSPDNITIFGESAGSVSVQYQLMYPRNDELFQGAISQSGSVLCIWAFQRQPRKIALDLGYAAGIFTNDTKKLMRYLQGLSTEKLKSATTKSALKNSLGIINGIPFAPTIEPEHPEAFLTSKPHQLLREGGFIKVPYIIGFNSAEAFLPKLAFDLATPLLRFYDVRPNILVPNGMNVGKNTERVGRSIKQFYISDKSKTEQFLEYVNDGYFYRPIMESARLFSNLTPTFMYCFSYEGMLGRRTLGYNKINDYKGAVHTEEMAYIWSRNYLPEPNFTDKFMTRKMVRLWTNFAKTGSPILEPEELLDNVSWLTVSSDMAYLDIDTKMEVKYRYRDKSMAFWRDLYEKYGRPPYDTY